MWTEIQGDDLLNLKSRQFKVLQRATAWLPVPSLRICGLKGTNLRATGQEKETGGNFIMDIIPELLKTIAHAPIKKRAITNHGVLNEAYAYAKLSSLSRGMRIDLNGLTILLISGTASIDELGRSVHVGDFRAQMRRTLKNITGLLASEDATWHDVVRTSLLFTRYRTRL